MKLPKAGESSYFGKCSQCAKKIIAWNQVQALLGFGQSLLLLIQVSRRIQSCDEFRTKVEMHCVNISEFNIFSKVS